MPASLDKDDLVITISTPKLTEGVISTKVEKGGLVAGVAKGDSSDFSFLILTNLEKDGLVITTTSESTKGILFAKVGKVRPAAGILEGSSSIWCLLV